MGLETKCTVTCVTLFTLNQGVEVLFRGKKNVLESLHSFTFGLHLSTKSLHRACLNSLISLHLVYIQGPNGCKKQVERQSLTHSALLAFYANYHLKHFVFSSMCHKLWVEFFVIAFNNQACCFICYTYTYICIARNNSFISGSSGASGWHKWSVPSIRANTW